ncbi:Agenet domain containing protein [Parasponia andersonii]|uniref:Agenet domain containing protein n=1 Tax=Parasponia andersonii TaxID=3476 RepID=A0A2P5DCS1_PARAD|nr:Agenet domain containing protein [Parasponia andersonii]
MRPSKNSSHLTVNFWRSLLVFFLPFLALFENFRNLKNPNAVLPLRSLQSLPFRIDSILSFEERSISSSEELFREGNAFSGESSSSVSSINLEDYLEPEPEIEITGARQSSPRIGDLPQDQWPRHIRDAPAFSSGYQYIEGNWSCTNVRMSCTANKLRKIASSYKIAIPMRLPMDSELRPHWDWEDPKWVRPEKLTLPEAIFRPGTAVEVDLNAENPGFNWVPVVFLGEVGKDFVVVKYKKSSNNGESVKVTVHVQQIRPQPPEMNDTNFDLLDKVDAFCDLSWSVGVITKILSERRYVVTFRLEKKEKEFNHSEVRPHLDWIDGQWVTNSGEVVFTPGCEEQPNHACNTRGNTKSSTLNESSGSTMEDTETGTPSSPNKQHTQKELSPCVGKSAYFKTLNKEVVNHTSNGDESAQVIMITDDEGIELSKRPLVSI